MHGRAEFGIEEQQHALEHGARHVQRTRGAGQRLATGIVHHLFGDPLRQDQGFAQFEREVLGVLGEGGHLQNMERARGAGGGNSRRGFQRRIVEIVQDHRAFAGAGREEHVADFGGIVGTHRKRGRHPQLRFRRRLHHRLAGRRGGNRRRDRQDLIGARTPQLELVHDLGRGRRIDREPRPHRSAGGVVDLVDQAGRQFDEMAFLVGGMGAGLDVKVGQHAQQGRPDIDALAARERHQPVESWKHWSCGHVRLRDLVVPDGSLPMAL